MLVDQLTRHLTQIHQKHPFAEYSEPFFGGGAVCFSLLQKLPTQIQRVHINDLDAGIAALWTAVVTKPDEFKQMIQTFVPSVDLFYQYQKELIDGKTMPLMELALKKLAIHQMSYSGLGVVAGGPIGGRTQKSSRYKVDCRWSPKHICHDINRINQLLEGKEVRVTGLDYREVLKNADQTVGTYLDPPYFLAGPQLYQFSFTEAQHRELHTALTKLESPWILSYDKHDFIKTLYSDCTILEVPISYTINGIAKTFELVIIPKGIHVSAQ